MVSFTASAFLSPVTTPLPARSISSPVAEVITLTFKTSSDFKILSKHFSLFWKKVF